MGKNKYTILLNKNSELQLSTVLRALASNASRYENFLKGHAPLDPIAKNHKYLSGLYNLIRKEPEKSWKSYINQMKKSGKEVREFIENKILSALGWDDTFKSNETKEMATGFIALLQIEHTLNKANTFNTYKEADGSVNLDNVLRGCKSDIEIPDELKTLSKEEKKVVDILGQLSSVDLQRLFQITPKFDSPYGSIPEAITAEAEAYEEASSLFKGFGAEDAAAEAKLSEDIFKTVIDINREVFPEALDSELLPGAAKKASDIMEKLGSKDFKETLKDVKYVKSKDDKFAETLTSKNPLSPELKKDLKKEREEREEKVKKEVL